MRDGINIAKLGVPAVALVTEKFWDQGDFISRSLGMPNIPRILLPHPVAGLEKGDMEQVAESLVEPILELTAGDNPK